MALRRTETLKLECVPLWAAHWLVNGYDTPLLREIAGLSGEDIRAVDAALPSAMAELGVPEPELSEAVAVTCAYLAAEGLAANVAVQSLGRLVWRLHSWLMLQDASSILYAHPLWEAASLEDEASGRWGRSPKQLQAQSMRACQRQLETFHH